MNSLICISKECIEQGTEECKQMFMGKRMDFEMCSTPIGKRAPRTARSEDYLTANPHPPEFPILLPHFLTPEQLTART